MPRGSRHKSHKQHRHSVKDLTDSEDDGATTVRHGPELVPELADVKLEVKKSREESFSAKGGNRLGKQEAESGDGGKRKLPSQQGRDLLNEDFTATYLPSKKRRERVDSAPDRWNGGGQRQGHDGDEDGDAHSLFLPYRGKDSGLGSKGGSDSSEGNVGVEVEKDHRSKGMVSGSRAITVIDVPGAFQTITDTNIRIKNKVSRRKETAEDAGHEEVARKFTEECAPTKADSDAGKKTAAAKSGSRRRWDKDAARKEIDGGITNKGVVGSSEREKGVRDAKVEKSVNVLPGAGGVFEGSAKQGFRNDSTQEEASGKQRGENTEWQLQDDLRNPELEKELEKRIRRRRDESGERDKWQDDDRDGEGKRHYLRDDRQKDDRYRDERQRDDRHRDGRHRDEKYREGRHRDDKHRDDKQRGDQLSREQAVDRFRDETRVSEGRHKENKHHDLDQDYGSYFDDWYAQLKDHHDQNRLPGKHGDFREHRSRESKDSAERDCRLTSKGHVDESFDQQRTGSVQPCSGADDATVIDDRQTWTRDISLNITREQQRAKLKHVESRSKDNSIEERPQCTKGGQDARKFSELHARSKEPGIRHSKNRAERKLDSHRGESPLVSARSPPYDGRASPVLSHFERSPQSNGRISPVHVWQRSPSPSIHNNCLRSSNEKTCERNTFEHGNNIVSGLGMHHQGSKTWHNVEPGDADKKHFGVKEELERNVVAEVCKESEDCRHISPPMKEMVSDSALDNPTVDDFTRAASIYAAEPREDGSQNEVFGNNGHSRRVFSTGAPSASSGGPSKGRRVEEMPCSRVDWTPLQSNKPIGSPLRPQAPPLPSWPSNLLPPPPPFRPGIDNPSILGPSSSCLEEGPYARDQGSVDRKFSGRFKRGDVNGGSGQGNAWKGVANWNSQGQGLGPNNNFIPFQHQVVSLPPGGFHNMGQQYPGPPIFGGVRPSADMSHSGVRYHVRDGGELFSGHGPAFGWRKQADDVCGPHVQGHLHAWDGPGSYGDESHIYGRPDWDQNRQGISNRRWDRVSDMWKSHTGNTSREFPMNKEPDYQGRYATDESWGGPRGRHEKFRRERSPAESIEIKRCDEDPAKVVTENSQRTLPSKAWKPCSSEGERARLYLSKLDISSELAGPDLYSQCVNLLGQGEIMRINDVYFRDDMSTKSSKEDFQSEWQVDADAEALIHSFDTRSKVFPSIPETLFQRAMTLYRKVKGEIKLEHITNSFENTLNASQEQVDKPFLASEGVKVEACCTTHFENTMFEVTSTQNKFAHPEMEGILANELPCSMVLTVQNETQIDQRVSDAGIENDAREMGFVCPNQSSSTLDLKQSLNSTALLGDTLFQVKQNVLMENMKISETTSNICGRDADIEGIENSFRDRVAILDSCRLMDLENASTDAFVEPATTTESDCDSNKIVKKDEGEAEFDSRMLDLGALGQACESCTRKDLAELDSKGVTCEHENQLNKNFCTEATIQIHESQVITEIACEEALKCASAESDDKYSENLNQYNLPENTH